MSNYEEFGGMVTYAFGLKHRKFYTGKQIKDIITRCLSDETITGYKRRELVDFANKYIHSKYPLANNTLYSLHWSGDDMDELKCCKHPSMKSGVKIETEEIKMVRYKIYFDGEKFVMEDKKSLVENTPNDSVVSWNAGLDTAIAAVDSLNKSHKSKPEELIKSNDFLIRKCKDCNTYFMLDAMQVAWFERRNLKIPCRCIACREKKKSK